MIFTAPDDYGLIIVTCRDPVSAKKLLHAIIQSNSKEGPSFSFGPRRVRVALIPLRNTLKKTEGIYTAIRLDGLPSTATVSDLQTVTSSFGKHTLDFNTRESAFMFDTVQPFQRLYQPISLEQTALRV
jgi:hypothetical protein